MAKKSGCSNFLSGGVVALVLVGLVRSCSAPSPNIGTPVASNFRTTQSSSSGPLPQTSATSARAKDGTVIEHPESYVPSKITLVKPVSMVTWKNGESQGLTEVPVGTELKLKAIKGRDVEIEYEGRTKAIPASSTDLLDQMVHAVGD